MGRLSELWEKSQATGRLDEPTSLVMSLAVITPIAHNLWAVAFYRCEHGRFRLASRLTCDWENALLLLGTPHDSTVRGRTR